MFLYEYNYGSHRQTAYSLVLNTIANDNMASQILYFTRFVQQRRQCTVTAITQACSAAVAEFLMGIDQHVNAERYEYERKLHGC